MKEADLQAYIDEQVEESLTLDFKAAAALAKTDSKRAEVTKDVSALANSAGGRLIYGIREFQDQERKHLPESIDPVDRQEFSKEWLEHVIGNIQPRIQDLVITPVTLSHGPSAVAYVLDVPQGTTAHQARDLRYYKRYNFESVPMTDYEIRDVMNRSRAPVLRVRLDIEPDYTEVAEGFPPRQVREDTLTLNISIENIGRKLARFVNGFLEIPAALVHESRSTNGILKERGGIVEVQFDNTRRDVVDIGPFVPGLNRSIPKYGPSWFSPILPRLISPAAYLRLVDSFVAVDTSEATVKWSLFADDAEPATGEVKLEDIEWVQERVD